MMLDDVKHPGREVLDLARRFFAWWGAELKALVPDAFARAGRAGRTKLLLHLEGAGRELVAYRGENGAATEVARRASEPWEAPDPMFQAAVSRARGPVILCLPPWRVLRHLVVLPGAARDNLREVLGFEMDRQTPFGVDDVYYDFQVLDRPRPDGQLLVDLVVTPRRIVDDWIRKLQQLGVTLAAVTVGRSDDHDLSGGEPRFNLLPSESAPRATGRSFRRLNTALAASAAVLVAVALALPLMNMHRTQVQLQTQVDAAQIEAEQVKGLRDELQTQVGYAAVINARKQEKPPVVELLAELARILPDDTWLTTVNLQSTKLSIHGESRTASQLIGVLESSPLLAEPAFVSSVIPNPATGYERFQISMTLDPGS